MGLEKATFGAGCFWCVEAIFEKLNGVKEVVSGYAGGTTENPTYDEVCGGNTDHVEVIQISFDPKIITYEKLLDVFWMSHDPTTKNRQGADIGTQYRSVIYHHTENQKKMAEQSMIMAEDLKMFSSPIVTDISPLRIFYEAENYHQNYFQLNSDAPYCRMVIQPKLEKIFNK
jgi:peptide-methionine (S)-S-oxide reductase